ncbi:MAG: PilZ domain-containing protein [Desulfobacterales bacterium]|jgi:Tfp pilus assembly protein PilZ
MGENPENRNNARIKYKSPVRIENLKAGVIYQARMLDYSAHGLYFETDSLLRLGEEIFIGIEYSPYTEFNDTYECVRAKIMWRRELPTSYFKYGYGVRYSIDYDKQRLPNTNLKIVEDQRKHPRKPYSKSIVYATKNHLKKAITKNICPAGVFIETDDAINTGQTITLAIPLKKAKTARISAKVIWSSEDGFGVKFLRIKKI